MSQMYVEQCIMNTQMSVRTAPSTQRQIYLEMNPTLSVSQVYSDNSIPEYCRCACTKVRLQSSHNLRIETGRWSRLPREHRTCECELYKLKNMSCCTVISLKTLDKFTLNSRL